MEKINITVNRQTRMIDRISKRQLGNDGENLQENLIFSFDDEFVDGTGRLEVTMPDDTKSYIMLTKVNETYQIPVKSVMTKSGRIYMQLVITEGTNNEDIPIFKSNTFYVKVNESINAETIQEEEFPDFIDIANTKLNQMDNFDINVSKTGNTATIEVTNRLGETTTASISDGPKGNTGATGPQGEPGYTPVKGVDYYTEEEKEEMIDYVINDSESAFNQNVAQKTNAFNTNADSKTNAFNSNATSKTGDFNTNATSKTTLFDNNATSKTTAFNTNASEKTTAFNNNAISKTSDFDSHVSGKTTDFDTHVTSKVGEYDANATEKTTTFNSNASSKLEEYNTNATSKVSDYNENAQDKIDEYDEHVEETQETINDLQSEVDDLRRNQKQDTASGTNIYVDDAFDTRIMESRMSKESTQETTSGKNLLNLEDIVRSASNVIFNSQTSNSVSASGSTAWNSFGYFINNIEHNTDYTLSFKMIEKGISSKKRVQIIGNNIAGVNDSTTIQNKSLGTLELNSEINDFVTFNSGDYEYIGLVFWNNDSGTALSSSTIWNITNIQLEQGSTATPYEPYTNGASPNPSYPQEVKTVKGYRNLFDNTEIELGVSWHGILNSNRARFYIPFTPNEYYTISSISMPESITQLAVIESSSPINTASGKYNTTISSTFTHQFNSNAEYLLLQFEANTTFTREMANNIKLVLSKGTKALPYVPYGNNYVYTKVVGKNLIGLGTPLNGYVNQSNLVFNSSNTSIGYYFKTSELPDTITFNATGGNRANVSYFDEIPAINSVAKAINPSTSTPHLPRTIQVDKTYKYAHIQFSYNNADLSEIQPEQGTQATEYEPYKENIITIPLNGNEIAGIGDYKDELIVDKNGKCWLSKKVGKVVLNGSENWETLNNISYSISKTHFVNNNIPANNISNYLTNYFTIVNAQQNANIGNVWAGANYINFDYDNTNANLSQFKEWLSTHNTDVYYVLATPQLIDLNYTVDIRLFNGVNNISNSDDMDMEIKYVQDINMIINNITNAMLEIGGN